MGADSSRSIRPGPSWHGGTAAWAGGMSPHPTRGTWGDNSWPVHRPGAESRLRSGSWQFKSDSASARLAWRLQVIELGHVTPAFSMRLQVRPTEPDSLFAHRQRPEPHPPTASPTQPFDCSPSPRMCRSCRSACSRPIPWSRGARRRSCTSPSGSSSQRRHDPGKA